MVFTPVDFSNLFITIDGITRIADLPPRNAGQVSTEANYVLDSDGKRIGPWTEDEHKQFISAITEFPRGPWQYIVSRIPTRKPKQVRANYKKYAKKIERHARGLYRGTSLLKTRTDGQSVCYPANLDAFSVSHNEQPNLSTPSSDFGTNLQTATESSGVKLFPLCLAAPNSLLDTHEWDILLALLDESSPREHGNA